MGEMAVLGKRGDTKILWTASNADEVAEAQRTFERLVGERRFAAFRVRANGDQGERMHTFDATAEKVILVPPMAGG